MEERFIREKKELAYHAHIFDVYNDYLILPDGQKVIYDLIDHIPGCCVLPVDENGQLIFVRQYRNAVDDMTLEVPAGCMDKGETPEQCIRRELKEETGFTAEQLMFVTKTCLAIGTSGIGVDGRSMVTKNDYSHLATSLQLERSQTNIHFRLFVSLCCLLTTEVH